MPLSESSISESTFRVLPQFCTSSSVLVWEKTKLHYFFCFLALLLDLDIIIWNRSANQNGQLFHNWVSWRVIYYGKWSSSHILAGELSLICLSIGTTAKRERIPHAALSFFGMSQPDSFLNIYCKMANMGNGLVDRILCCCPLLPRLTRSQVNNQVDSLQLYSTQNLNSIYGYVYYKHRMPCNRWSTTCFQMP